MPKIAMSHNVVMLKKEADAAAFATAAASARATDFIPAANKADVIANTPLAGNGETVEVVFKVPAAAGSYPFLCTFPGHFVVGMKGNLVVKYGHSSGTDRGGHASTSSRFAKCSTRRLLPCGTPPASAIVFTLNFRVRTLQRPWPMVDVHLSQPAAALVYRQYRSVRK